MTEDEVPHHNRKPLLWGLTAGFLLIGLIVFLFWFFILRFEVKTKDAYVNGNQIVLTPQISGFINCVTVEDTEVVEEGRVLVQLDTTDREIALERAKAALAETVRSVAQLFEDVGRFKAETERRKVEMANTGKDFEHRKKLIASGAISAEDLQHAEANFIAAFASLLSAQHQLRGAEALVDGTTLSTHPLVEKGKEDVREAYVNLQRCTIRSPVSGMIANKQAQVGESIAPSTPLMMIIPLDQIWIDANFKEVQLKNVRIGQPVKMKADIYGSDIIYQGKVIGIAAGTGSAFAVLPPQNATGNWIKIVQRLPVRIILDPAQLKDHPLRIGLSMDVKVDIHDTSGKMIPAPLPFKALYVTDIFERQKQGADDVINSIIAENTPKEESDRN